MPPLMPDEAKAIDEENLVFFINLSKKLFEEGYPPPSPVAVTIKPISTTSCIKDRFISAKSGNKMIIVHRPAAVLKEFKYYAQMKYNIFLRSGCKILYFKDHPDALPMVETVNGVNQVVGPGKGSVSLLEYLRKYKESEKPDEKAIFDSITGDHFLKATLIKSTKICF